MKVRTAQYLQLEKELRPYLEVLSKASESIIDKEISKYPILVVHQQQIELGVPVLSKDPKRGNWSVNASTLEEFAMKQVIHPEKIEDFQGIYKDPGEHLCLFVISELGAKFIFLSKKN